MIMILKGDNYMWNIISGIEEVTNFMKKMNCFHDSCIKEIKYTSGSYVDKDFSMYPINDERTLRMIIERQDQDNAIIEMEFKDLIYIKMYPIDEKNTSEILDVNIFVDNDKIIWCDNGDVSLDSINNYQGTVICAKYLRWRKLNNDLLGSEGIYTDI